MTLRPLRAYKEISRDISELKAQQASAEVEARRDLAAQTKVFTSRSRKVVDETMSLSAVLMRAGEVEEATRLLAEVDREVETEKAALIESVNVAKTKQFVARKKMTRLRMARMLLSAVLGASLMMFSAFGVALARYLAPSPAQGAQGESLGIDDNSFDGGRDVRKVKHIRFAGVKIPLTEQQLAEYERLTALGADDRQLTEFLKKILDPTLADKVLAATAPVTEGVAGLVDATKKVVKDTSASSTQQSSSSSSAKKSESKQSSSSGSADDSGSDEGEGSEKGCDPDDGDDQRGDSNFGGPLGGCIPVVNEESPV